MTSTDLSAHPSPVQLAWRCDSCRYLISDHDGYLYVLFGEISRTREAREEREASRQDDHASTLAEILSYPRSARWRVRHVDCDPDTDDPGYWIPVERARTHGHLLWWTSHLMGKSWLEHTNWDRFIKKASGVDA